MRQAPLRKRRRTKHQIRNQQHREYLDWLHGQPCAYCGTSENIQAAHVGQGGAGMKHGTDAETIPLCGTRLADGTGMLGCHQLYGEHHGSESWRVWYRAQITIHRQRFEARI